MPEPETALIPLPLAAAALDVSPRWLAARVVGGELLAILADDGWLMVAPADLDAYKALLDARRDEALAGLARLTQELGDDGDGQFDAIP